MSRKYHSLLLNSQRISNSKKANGATTYHPRRPFSTFDPGFWHSTFVLNLIPRDFAVRYHTRILAPSFTRRHLVAQITLLRLLHFITFTPEGRHLKDRSDSRCGASSNTWSHLEIGFESWRHAACTTLCGDLELTLASRAA